MPDIAFKRMKIFNFDSEEDAENVDLPSIEMTDIDICHYRIEVETYGDVDPLQ